MRPIDDELSTHCESDEPAEDCCLGDKHDKYTALRDLGRHLLMLVSRTDRLAPERLERPQPAVEAVSP